MPARREPDRVGTALGVPVLVERDPALPLVDVALVLRTGAVDDPAHRDGLTRLTWRVVRMGTRGLRSEGVEDRLARLGARLAMEVAPSYVRLHGTVLRRNLDGFVALLARLVLAPAFRAADLAHAVRETRSELVAARDDDAFLAARRFRGFLFGDHPYGRTLTGTSASLRGVRRGELAARHGASLVRGNVAFGFAGDVVAGEAADLVDRHFAALPPGPGPGDAAPPPRAPRGRRVLVVDKPDRTQSQIYAGTLGARQRDPDATALQVANLAFGGSFCGRLMQEIRERRGWSYGAYSRLGQDRQRDAWTMWTFPAVERAVDCVALQLDLLEGWVDGGLTRGEVAFAKRSLVQGHCFEIDTAAKRLDARLDEELYGLRRGTHGRFPERVRGVTADAANAAVRRRISPRDVSVVLVASAAAVVPGLERLPGIRSVEVVPYDAD